MPRPLLIDFRDDGTIDIDKSVYALPEISAIAKLFGKPSVDMLVRLYMYRSPINPYDDPEAREARALSDAQVVNKCQIDPTITDSPEWKAARERFLKERFDSVVDSMVLFETKCDEFNRAIATTPVSEVFTRKATKAKSGRGKRDIVDDVFSPDDTETVRKDNTDALKNMATTLAFYQKQLEELRQQVMRQKGGKQQRSMRASDYKNVLN